MTTSKKTEAATESAEEKFASAIFRFSASLSDLREFSELVESLIKKHKLRELETALARYDGLGDALCHFDTSLKPEITSIQNACSDDVALPSASLKFEVKEGGAGGKVLRAAGNREDLKEFDKSIGARAVKKGRATSLPTVAGRCAIKPRSAG